MRARLAWLLSLTILLATVIGGGAALAHPCHAVMKTMAATPMAAPAVAVAPAADAVLERHVRMPVVSPRLAEAPRAGPTRRPDHDAPCHCPDGRGDCHGHCLGMTAAVMAVAEIPGLQFFPGRLRLAFGDAENASRWTPSTDLDPPRPGA